MDVFLKFYGKTSKYRLNVFPGDSSHGFHVILNLKLYFTSLARLNFIYFFTFSLLFHTRFICDIMGTDPDLALVQLPKSLRLMIKRTKMKKMGT